MESWALEQLLLGYRSHGEFKPFIHSSVLLLSQDSITHPLLLGFKMLRMINGYKSKRPVMESIYLVAMIAILLLLID